MEFLKKYGFWLIIGVVALGAVIFYFTAVRGQAAQYDKQINELESRKEKIKKLAGQGDSTPNDRWIEREGELAKLVEGEIKKCQTLIVYQRRHNQVKLFWRDDDPLRKEVDTRSGWLQYYEEAKAQVRSDVRASGVASEGLLSFPDYWGNHLPTWGEIRNAQVHFWLRRDIISIIINQHEKDLAEELSLRRDERLKTLLDVVVNPKPGTLSAVLQAMPEKTLIRIMEDIVVNAEQQDLGEVFSRYGLYERVLDITMDAGQRQFVRDLRGTDKDRNDLADFVMDLRMVRYRDDLVGLLKNHGFSQIADRLRDWNPQSQAILLDEISTWRPLRLARGIEAAMSIVDERDLSVVLRNHRVRLASVDNLKFEDTLVFEFQREGQPAAAAGGRPGEMMEGGRAGATSIGVARGVAGVYNAFPFALSVTMEFRHVPVLVRRLLMSDWRVEIQGMNITKVEARGTLDKPQEVRETPGAPPPGMPGARPDGAGRLGGPVPGVSPGVPGPVPGAPGGAPGVPGAGPAAGVPPGVAAPDAAEDAAAKKKEARIAPRHYVRVDLTCEARHFYPLWKAQNPADAEIVEAKFKEQR